MPDTFSIEILQNEEKNLSIDKNIKNCFKEWCLCSTTHGISSITRNNYKILKFLWILCLIAVTIICGILLYQSLIDYYRYGVNTNIDVVKDLDAYFPTISLCNINPFNTSNEKINKEFSDLLNDQFNYQFTRNHVVPALIVKGTQKFLKSYVSKKNDSEKILYGQSLDGMMIDCIFSTAPCHMYEPDLSFQWFYNFEYGNCYKFNWNLSKPLQLSKAGYRGGLHLELYLGNSSSNETFINKRGFRLAIHNMTDKYVDLEDQGIDIAGGFTTNIHIKRTYYQRLGYPYSNCVEDLTINNPYKTHVMKQMFDELKMTFYSQKLCEKFVFSQYLNSQCNCSDPSFFTGNDKQYCVLTPQVRCYEDAFVRYYSNLILDINNSSYVSCPEGNFMSLQN